MIKKTTKAEFISECKLRGLCSMDSAEMYADRFSDGYEFSEKDLEDAYRMAERHSGVRSHILRSRYAPKYHGAIID